MHESFGYVTVNKEEFSKICHKLIDHYTTARVDFVAASDDCLRAQYEKEKKNPWNFFTSSSFERFKASIDFLTMLKLPKLNILMNKISECEEVISVAKEYLQALESPLIEAQYLDLKKVNWLTNLANKV